MKENNHIIPAIREEIITNDGQAKYYFAEKYFNTDWHRITDSEIDFLMEKHISDNIGRNSVSFGVCVFLLLALLIELLLEVINFNAFNAIFIAFLVSLFIGVYTYFEETLFVRSLEEADVCILPIYNLYMLRKREKDKIKEYHYAEAFYGYELYKFNINADDIGDIGATDIVLVNIGNHTKTFPIVIEEHIDRNGCSRGYHMYTNKARLPFTF
ncbi:MAG: hypothetical protein J6A58_12845 [Oscillospiraceae bacterium]|nr:hypothetical protein [Oscillospiraceae bacterium]